MAELRALTDWTYLNVDPEREARLRTPIEFRQLVESIVAGRVFVPKVTASGKPTKKVLLLEKRHPHVETNEEELLTLDKRTPVAVGASQRVVFYLLVDKQTHDTFVNSPFGLFGQYYESAAQGRASMAELIQTLRNTDSLKRDVSKGLTNWTEQDFNALWQASLSPDVAVGWFDEEEFPGEKFKRNAVVALGPAAPQIATSRWTRRVFIAGTRLEVKGAWVTAVGDVARYHTKGDLDKDLYAHGFS